MTQTQPTPEQLQIIQHNHGAALVYAVAGAGKTTCLTQRILRLVRERVFRPERILATSFSRESVRDIQQKLAHNKAAERVHVRTLHGVGLAVLKQAVQLGLVPEFKSEVDQEGTRNRLIRQVLREARLKGLPIPDHFDLEDFMNYVGSCKASLKYADLLEWDFPEAALSKVSQAEAPEGLPHYLELYRAFERLRERENFVTFDDMILLAWDLAVKNPILMQEVASRYDCVLIDEYQDLNLAQAEFVHLLVQNHLNIMALGDDDQTIYSWRGSSPEFIRTFQERYGATKYFITHNFRSTASQLALANFVIQQNQNREVKHLRLTRGFEGSTEVLGVDSQFEMARLVADQIEKNLERGMKFPDHAILVRTYAITPFIETELIERQIPYRILGGNHFYKREEIQVLLAYLRVARLLDQLQTGQTLDPGQLRDLKNLVLSLVGVPRRYITRQYINSLFVRLLGQENELLSQLEADSENPQYARFHSGLQALHYVLQNLTRMVAYDSEAHMVLENLLYWTDYENHLQATTADPELAEAKWMGARNLIRYAEGKGNVESFLQHMDFMAFREGTLEALSEERVLITTPYRAKGLEWPVVFIPGLNEGTLPTLRSLDSPEALEEERRVLYVSITRARQHLYLYHLDRDDGPPISRFLSEPPREGEDTPPVTHQDVLQDVQKIQQALSTPEDQNPSGQDLHALLHLVRKHHFRTYIEHYAYRHFDLDHLLLLSSKVLGAAEALKGLTHFDPQDLQVWEGYGQAPMPVKFTRKDLEGFLGTG